MKKYFLILIIIFLTLISVPSSLLAHVDVTPEQAKDMIDTNPELYLRCFIITMRLKYPLCSPGNPD